MTNQDVIPSIQCILTSNTYGFYCVPLSSAHRPAAKAILKNDVWEPQTIDFIINNCGERDVVHAGTFFGDFLPAIAKALSPGALLWAFEPNPENYACALWTLKLNHVERVQLFQAGLGACDEIVPLRVRSDNGTPMGGASRFLKARRQAVDGQSILDATVMKLDTVIGNREVGLIHLDVEGYEQQALEGAATTIRRNKPILILETLPPSGWMSEHLFALGYEKRGLLHANTWLSI